MSDDRSGAGRRAGIGASGADIVIAGRAIGAGHVPFVIAEMSGNHNQSIERALAIVEAAARAGAHALKLQTYTADTMTLDVQGEGFQIRDPDSLWQGASLYQLYKQAHTPWEWHETLFSRAHELGMVAFSTPFDESAVDFLESLGAPCYKIASFENTDLPLIRRVARTGKPMIMSTGMASVAELDDSVRAAREAGCRDLVLLKCTSTYPATPDNTNVATIPHMRELFGCQVGLSDHTMGVGAAVAAVALGATVVEKHFTLRRADGGVDSSFSLEPEEMAQLVVETARAWQSLGHVQYGPIEAERKSLQFRRSLYVVKDLQAGEELTAENVRALRPGMGLPPKHLDEVLGRKVNKPVARGTPLSWSLLK
jgi:pseudaminic acid synthase